MPTARLLRRAVPEYGDTQHDGDDECGQQRVFHGDDLRVGDGWTNTTSALELSGSDGSSLRALLRVTR